MIVCHPQKRIVTCMSMTRCKLEVGNRHLSYSETDLDKNQTARQLPEKRMQTDSLGSL